MPRKIVKKPMVRNVSDPKKFAMIEHRIEDIFLCQYEAIEKGQFIRTAPDVFKEMKWLCDEIRGTNARKKAAEVVEDEEQEAELVA